jgi:F-type H+-transporting ATPase subunit epsilon
VAEGLRLLVVTPERRVVDVLVEEVQLPGALGELGVLPNHTPLLSTLGIGVLSYRGRGVEGALAVAGGFVEVLADQVTVLADRAERPDEVDVAAARAQGAAAEAAMKSARAEELEGLSAEVRLAATRIAVAEGGRR